MWSLGQQPPQPTSRTSIESAIDHYLNGDPHDFVPLSIHLDNLEKIEANGGHHRTASQG